MAKDRTVKKAGMSSWNTRHAKGQTDHGSPYRKGLSRLGGKAMGRDSKPGFLSRSKGPW